MSSRIVHNSLFANRVGTARLAGESAPQPISRLEVTLVGLIALAMSTGLLLRLPYRSPVTNILLSGLAFVVGRHAEGCRNGKEYNEPEVGFLQPGGCDNIYE